VMRGFSSERLGTVSLIDMMQSDAGFPVRTM
jgi:hypothetical protein